MDEQWLLWAPIRNVDGPYLMTKISYDTPGLMVFLKQKNTRKTIQLLFEGCVEAYRFIDINGVSHKTKNRGYVSTGVAFFKVLHSTYLNRLSAKSCGISDTRGLTHFVIVAFDGILEVAHSTEPLITEQDTDHE